jgi:hypothetical protein
MPASAGMTMLFYERLHITHSTINEANFHQTQHTFSHACLRRHPMSCSHFLTFCSCIFSISFMRANTSVLPKNSAAAKMGGDVLLPVSAARNGCAIMPSLLLCSVA